MTKLWMTLIVGIIALMGIGIIYLMSVDIDPPTTQVVKTIPDENFPK